MAFKLHDWIMDTSNTTGTDDFLLAGPVLTWRGFDDVLADGDTIYYSASLEGQRETGLGTYVAGSNTLQRTTVFESTNGGAKVSFPAGTKVIVCAPPASQMLTRKKDRFEARKATSQSSATGTKVVFPTVVENVGGLYDATNSRAIPKDGQTILLKGSISVALATSVFATLNLLKNGSIYRSKRITDATGSGEGGFVVDLVEAVTGNGSDYYEWSYAYNGASMSIAADSAKTYFTGIEI